MRLAKLGIELRKIGDTKHLYEDVDMVLSTFDVPHKSINATVQIQTCAHSLQKMMRTEKHFDVCTIRNCADLCQICIPQERMDVYHAIHCMDWKEMVPDYRKLIVAMVLDDFREVLNIEVND